MLQSPVTFPVSLVYPDGRRRHSVAALAAGRDGSQDSQTVLCLAVFLRWASGHLRGGGQVRGGGGQPR